MPLSTVPVIDLETFLKGSPESKSRVARKIGDACRDVGFFYITSHGIPQNVRRGGRDICEVHSVNSQGFFTQTIRRLSNLTHGLVVSWAFISFRTRRVCSSGLQWE